MSALGNGEQGKVKRVLSCFGKVERAETKVMMGLLGNDRG